MKRFFLAAVMAAFGTMTFAPAVVAGGLPTWSRSYDSHRVIGNVLESYPVYGEASTRNQRVCQDVQVPIYSGVSPNEKVGNVVAGAVLGGILGQIVTGNKNGATTGAVLGGVVGATKNPRHISGYRLERQCNNVETGVNGRLKYYESRIRIEGRVYRVRTEHRLNDGGRVRMYMPN